MNIFHYTISIEDEPVSRFDKEIDRYERDPLGDLKHGLDLVFELKAKLDKLHPMATETLIQLMSD